MTANLIMHLGRALAWNTPGCYDETPCKLDGWKWHRWPLPPCRLTAGSPVEAQTQLLLTALTASSRRSHTAASSVCVRVQLLKKNPRQSQVGVTALLFFNGAGRPTRLERVEALPVDGELNAAAQAAEQVKFKVKFHIRVTQDVALQQWARAELQNCELHNALLFCVCYFCFAALLSTCTNAKGKFF